MGAIFSTENFADAATLVNVNGVYSRPLTELQKPWGRGLCRGAFSGAAVIQFKMDFGVAKDIITLGMVGMQQSAAVRFELANVSDFSVLVHDAITSYDQDWRFPFGPGCWVHANSVPWSARYVRVRVDVTGSPVPTWVDARRLWVGGGLILPEGVSTGWSIDVVDGSLSERTSVGGVYVDELTRWRRLSAGRSRLGNSEGMSLGNQIANVGRSREVVAAVRNNAGLDYERYYQTVFGQLTGWRPLRSLRGGYFELSDFVVEEAPMPALS